MTASELLTDLTSKGFSIALKDGKLQIGPQGRLTAELRREIKSLRDDLIAEIEQREFDSLDADGKRAVIFRLADILTATVKRECDQRKLTDDQQGAYATACAELFDEADVSLSYVAAGEMRVTECREEMDRLAMLVGIQADCI